MASTNGTRKITKPVVDRLKPGELIWDTEVRGFGVRCQRRDKVFVLKANVKKRARWFSIGPHGSPWTVEKARAKARVILGEIADGGDPAAIREEERKRPTVTKLCDWYLDEYAKEHKRASSYESDRRNIENHVKPLLGKLHIADVNRSDIDRFKRAVKDGKTAHDEKRGKFARSIVRGGPGAANRCLALLSKMFNWAEQRGYRTEGTNPCRHVEKYREGRSQRFLSEAELATLATALAEAEAAYEEADRLLARIKKGAPNKALLRAKRKKAREKAASQHAVAAIRLLLFTGARLGEILSLKWEQVHIDRGLAILPDSKTGQKAVFLNAPALDVLANLPRLENNPYVICGDKQGEALVNLQKPWRRIRERAGLSDVRLHDLRHSFASAAAAGGLSLPMIGKLLGHSQPQTTARYSHLAADPIRAANEIIGDRIAAAMNRPTPSPKIH